MTLLCRHVLFRVVFSAALLAFSASIATAERWALLIGNEAYSDLPALRNPLNDIRQFGARLRGLGFQVVEQENLKDSQALGEAVLTFAHDAKSANADSILVHYAGHGFQVDGTNYLMPTGVSRPDEAALTASLDTDLGLDNEQRAGRLARMRLDHLRTQSFPLDTVLAMMEKAAPTRILMFDACRDLPVTRTTIVDPILDVASTGFASAEGDAGTMIVFATQPGKVATDGGDQLSPFMQAMIDHMDERGLGIDDLFMRVRSDVYDYTRGQQTPWTHSALMEPFSFNPVRTNYQVAPLVHQQVDPAQRAEADQAHWQSVENSFDAEAYRGYLEAFPEGDYTQQAHELLRRLDALYGDDAVGSLPENMQVASRSQTAAPSEGLAQQPVRRIAILGDTDFVADRQPGASEAVGLPDALVDQIAGMLVQSPRFDVLERQLLRRVISEQRFDRSHGETYLERTFENNFGDVRPDGGDVVLIPDAQPEGGSGIVLGSGLGASAATADYVDLIKDFKDLGSSVGADLLVFGRLEPSVTKVYSRRIPYTQRRHVEETVSARLRLRVVDVAKAQIVAAVALETEIEANIFRDGPYDVRSAMFDRLARDVTGAIEDSFHQASLVQTKPMVVDRGAVHGIKPGDTFTIERSRPNALISSDGVKLGDHKTYVATVEATRVDRLWSEVDMVDGAPPSQFDSAKIDRDAATTPFLEQDVTQTKRKPKALRPGGEPEEGLPRLAVLPVRFTNSARKKLALDATADGYSEEPFAQSVATTLHQSKRFTLLERYQVERLIDEADLAMLDGQSPIPEKLLELDIADHLVMTEISLLDFTSPEERQEEATEEPGQGTTTVPKNDEGGDATLPPLQRFDDLKAMRMGKARGYLEGVIRIADGKTGVWLEARQISISIPLRKDAKADRIIAELTKEFAAKAGVELINSVFPLKVASRTGDGTVYVNRGRDGGLEVGEVLSAFRQGDAVIDPDTGILLGQEESLIGQVTLTRVDDFASIGIVASLDQPISKNDRLRRQNWNRGKTGGGSQVSGIGALNEALDGETASEDGKNGASVVALREVDFGQAGRFDLPPRDIRQRLWQELAGRLRASRRFVVAERISFDSVMSEVKLNNLIEGSSGLPEEMSQVDYVVLTRLDNLIVKTEREHNSILDETLVNHRAIVEAQIRLIDTNTFEQFAAETIRFERPLEGDRDQRLLLGDMLAALADEAVLQIMNVTYPLKVIGNGGPNRWYVNRGADGGLTVGDVFQVVSLGEALVSDGISYGNAEINVGRAVVVQVDAARSMIEVESGAVEVATGHVLRPFDQQPIIPAAGPAEPAVRRPQW